VGIDPSLVIDFYERCPSRKHVILLESSKMTSPASEEFGCWCQDSAQPFDGLLLGRIGLGGTGNGGARNTDLPYLNAG
jgi:hypothetical protein